MEDDKEIMTSALNAATITRLEKIAVDNGFDRELPRDGDWLGFASSQAPLRLWLSIVGETGFIAAFSQFNVVKAVADHGETLALPLPELAVGGRMVAGLQALHHLVRRSFQLSRTLPDELLHAFAKKTATMAKTTEAERLVVQRVGQDLFRSGLIEYWEGRCAITGLAVVELLRASHIKPWADCATDAERLDVFNGLLLAPHLDAAFDRGFITVADDGGVIVSERLSAVDRVILGLDGPLRVSSLAERHRHYLSWHREKVFNV